MKENNTNEKTMYLKKMLESASADLIPYEHSPKFIADGKEPLKTEKEHLKNLDNLDWLLTEKRVPTIRADTCLEITHGKHQYNNHLKSIQKIIDIERGELKLYMEMRMNILKEIAEYEKEIAQIEQQQNQLSIQGEK